MCIGDFWVTSERLAMGIDFLYSYSTDNMMLLARNTEKPPTLGDILRTPWQPFSSELWGTIVCYVLVVSAAVTLITDSGNEHDCVSKRLHPPRHQPITHKIVLITTVGVAQLDGLCVEEYQE